MPEVQDQGWLRSYLQRHTLGTFLLRLVCFAAALFATVASGYATLSAVFTDKALSEQCYFAPSLLCGRYLGIETDIFVLLHFATLFIIALFSLLATLISRRADVVIGAPLLTLSFAIFVREALSMPVEGG